MRAGKIFGKTWKFLQSMHRKFLQNIRETCKVFQNFKNFTKLHKTMSKNLKKTSREFTKKFQKAIQFFIEHFPFSPKNHSSHLAAQSNSCSYYGKKEERNGQLLHNLINRNTKSNNRKYPKNPFEKLVAEIRKLLRHRDCLLLRCHQRPRSTHHGGFHPKSGST